MRLLSESHNEKVVDSLLVPGYSCIVDEHSSLMNIKPGEIRVYDNIDHIISSFDKLNKKVQRSLSLIYQSNVKSGLTIPLKINNHVLGFLFLNSTKIGSFNKLNDQDFAILCLIQIAFQELLNNYVFEIMTATLLSALDNTENRNQISLINLEKDLENFFHSKFRKEVSFFIDINVDTNFLLTHKKFLVTVIIILKNIKNISACDKISLNLFSIEDNKIFTEISIDDGKIIEMDSDIKSLNFMDDVKVDYSKNKIVFSIKFESISDGLLYSV